VNSLLSTNLISTNVSVYSLSQLEALQTPVIKYNKHSFKQEAEVLTRQLFIQLVQHNLLVFYSFYSQISLLRMAEIMDVQSLEVEELLCDLINQSVVHARIDRVKGIVSFGEKKRENRVLEQWGRSVETLLNVVDQTTNLIKRDNEIHAI